MKMEITIPSGKVRMWCDECHKEATVQYAYWLGGLMWYLCERCHPRWSEDSPAVKGEDDDDGG